MLPYFPSVIYNIQLRSASPSINLHHPTQLITTPNTTANMATTFPRYTYIISKYVTPAPPLPTCPPPSQHSLHHPPTPFRPPSPRTQNLHTPRFPFPLPPSPTTPLTRYPSFPSRYLDPVFAITIGVSAAAVRIRREEKEKGHSVEDSVRALRRYVARESLWCLWSGEWRVREGDLVAGGGAGRLWGEGWECKSRRGLEGMGRGIWRAFWGAVALWEE